MRTFLSVVSALVLAAPAFAQGSLEGTTVVAKIDLPASSDGVTVSADGTVDFHKLADTIHQNGVGVHAGESIMITKVIVKDHHIEVQLGGGGYGTFADRLNEASAVAAATPVYEGKSRYEKDMEFQSKYDPNYWDRAAARDAYHDARNDRYRQQARDNAVAVQTQLMVKANAQAKRAGAGSRFNIRYATTVPSGAATPEGIMSTLGRYLDFGASPTAAAQPIGIGAPATSASPALRKGLTIPQVEQILGPAAKVNQRSEGSIETVVREYQTDGQMVVAQFVGGVLVDYKITPRG